MSFISASFAFLYLVAIVWRVAVRRSSPGYVGGLLALSWIFYAWHVPHYIVLILFSTTVDYVAARLIEAKARIASRARLGLLLCAVSLNLGLLGYFKYAGFLVENLMGGSEGWSAADIVLPIGISFYTFQSMSYTIDVYRGQIAAEKSFVRFACYIAFFPQLVAGPIVRARDFLYQLDRCRPLRAKVFAEGAYLIVRGLFLKVVVADNLGLIVDDHWQSAASGDAGSGLALSMLVFFACQLFCDFAGYTDIARGLAYQLGFSLPINFNAPYIAATFTDFWRRWHITLSTWFRDYVYIPLGGNRHSRVRAYVNVGLVMLIAGLWHGASWTFVLWGAVHGVAVIAERAIGFAGGPTSRVGSLVWYVVVQLTWVLSMGMFRAADAAQGSQVIRNALVDLAALPRGLDDPIELGWLFVVPVVALHARAALVEKGVVGAITTTEKAFVTGAMAAAIAMLYTTSQPFIYFQF